MDRHAHRLRDFRERRLSGPASQHPGVRERGYAEFVGDTLVTALVPLLAVRTPPEFNVFQVLHHGTHEKQLSNLFAWLLDVDGTHQLGDAFQTIFIDQVNRSWKGSPPLDVGPYSVRQEVNTGQSDGEIDIADLVLESESAVVVVENYHVSDGHHHGYHRYREFGARDGKISVVVMLCGTTTPGALADGWQDAAVVTYADLIEPLTAHVKADPVYQETWPQQCFFFDQMHAHFAKGRHVSDTEIIDFIRAVCGSGEANYYRQNPDLSAVNFADMLRERALAQFADSRDLLGRIKTNLLAYASGVLIGQVNEAVGEELLTKATANYRGIYQWTVNLHANAAGEDVEPLLQIKFGPSAWFAVEQDDYWADVPAAHRDYGHLFLTERVSKSVLQSNVTIGEVLAGIAMDDVRLRDELAAVVKR